MGLALSLASFFVIWWLVLFAVLPWGVRTQAEEGAEAVPGSAESAPHVPYLRRKLLITTLIAGALFAAFHWAVTSKKILLDDIPFLPRFEKIE